MAKERDLQGNFPIQAETGSLRQEGAAALSDDDQAFFYFRQTSEPQSLNPIIQSTEKLHLCFEVDQLISLGNSSSRFKWKPSNWKSRV